MGHLTQTAMLAAMKAGVGPKMGPPPLVHDVPLETLWGGQPGSVYPEYMKPPGGGGLAPQADKPKEGGGLLGRIGHMFASMWAD